MNKVIQMPKPGHYDFSTPIMDFSTGKPYQRQLTVDCTVEDVIVSALMAIDNNALPSPAEREARMLLAEKIKSVENITDGIKLSHEEIGLIRKASALSTPTQFYGWVMRSLEPKGGN